MGRREKGLAFEKWALEMRDILSRDAEKLSDQPLYCAGMVVRYESAWSVRHSRTMNEVVMVRPGYITVVQGLAAGLPRGEQGNRMLQMRFVEPTSATHMKVSSATMKRVFHQPDSGPCQVEFENRGIWVITG
jgi:hypothetical protein